MTPKKEFRVAEVFGPTIQGEGRNVGMPCHFIRFGGCDFRCSWCDSPHAVLPDLVAQLPKMSAWTILDKVHKLGKDGDFIRWVVLTGGNPGLLDLDELIDLLHTRKYSVMLETQGTTFRPWFAKVDDLCFSPKPPSAGNVTDLLDFRKILGALHLAQRDQSSRGDIHRGPPYLKIPIFDVLDLKYAENVHAQFPHLELFLSIGNTDPLLPTVGNPTPDIPTDPVLTGRFWTQQLVLENFKKVVEMVLEDFPALQDCRIFPQQHSLIWGNEKGR